MALHSLACSEHLGKSTYSQSRRKHTVVWWYVIIQMVLLSDIILLRLIQDGHLSQSYNYAFLSKTLWPHDRNMEIQSEMDKGLQDYVGIVICHTRDWNKRRAKQQPHSTTGTIIVMWPWKRNPDIKPIIDHCQYYDARSGIKARGASDLMVASYNVIRWEIAPPSNKICTSCVGCE